LGSYRYFIAFGKVLEAGVFEEFIIENLNLWLKNYIALTNFGVVLCGKLKTKILLNTLWR
jgi:hypothetical protein